MSPRLRCPRARPCFRCSRAAWAFGRPAPPCTPPRSPGGRARASPWAPRRSQLRRLPPSRCCAAGAARSRGAPCWACSSEPRAAAGPGRPCMSPGRRLPARRRRGCASRRWRMRMRVSTEPSASRARVWRRGERWTCGCASPTARTCRATATCSRQMRRWPLPASARKLGAGNAASLPSRPSARLSWSSGTMRSGRCWASGRAPWRLSVVWTATAAPFCRRSSAARAAPWTKGTSTPPSRPPGSRISWRCRAPISSWCARLPAPRSKRCARRAAWPRACRRRFSHAILCCRPCRYRPFARRS